MSKYIYIENPVKEHEKEIGEYEGRLVDLLKTKTLVNPNILLNDKPLYIKGVPVVDDSYVLKDSDTLVIVNTLKYAAVISAIVKIVISYALNQLLAPDKPSVPRQAEVEAPVTEFTVNTSQNQARNGQPVPECFGTYVRTPDIITATYRRYEANKQYLYMILCLGVGENTVNDVFIEDTNVNNFIAGSVEYRLYKNEAAHTGNNKIKDDWNTTFSDPYMRDIVITGKEIQNYNLTVAEPFNLIQLNPSGTVSDYLEFDINFPNGLYTQQSDGSLGNRDVTVRFTYKDSSAVTTTQDVIISGATRSPIRRTYGYSVTPDYYETKADRITADSTDSKIQDEVYLETMKAYLINADTNGSEYIRYGNKTLLAIKIKSTQAISAKAQFKVKVNATRDNLTRLDDILEYIWTSENGGRQNINEINLPDMPEPYNSVMTNRTTVLKALQSVASSRRYNLYPSFNIMTARKDELQPVRTMIFNEANIVKNSLKVNISSKDETDYDGVRCIYRNPSTFENEYATFPVSSSFPQDVPLDGVTDSVFALEQAEFLYNQDLYRNNKYRFDTELDGQVPSFNDRVGLSHPALGKTQSGIIIGFNNSLNQVELNETVKEDYTNMRILFRDRLGVPSAFYTVTAMNGRILTLDSALPTDLYTGDNEQKTIYTLGEGTTFLEDIFIIGIKPKKDNIVSITAYNYDERIY